MLRRLPRHGVSRLFFAAILIAFLLAMPGMFPARAATSFEAHPLGDFDDIAVIEVSGNFDAVDAYGRPNLEPRRVLAREFYRSHGDDYDFLVIFTNFDVRMPSPQALAFFAPAKNDVQGIGLSLYDLTQTYSPDGAPLTRLEGTIDMGSLAGQVLEPADPEFDDTLRTLTHELLHRWGAYLHFLDGGDRSGALLGRDGAHWSFLLDSGGSTLYGNRWRDNGDGTFTSLPPAEGRAGESIGRIFSPLELYLMGLIGKERVPPLRLIEAPGLDPTQLPQAGITIPGTLRPVTIDEIIAAEGERVPAAGDARKAFRMAFIYAVVPGSWSAEDPRARGELAAIGRLRAEWEKRFSILTDGAGMMSTRLADDIPAAVNPSLSVAPSLPAASPDVGRGIDWLVSTQAPDGAWRAPGGTVVRDTAAAVRALRLFPDGLTAAARGLDWLKSARPENNDDLARVLLAGDAAAAGTLKALQNADGGWGSAAGFFSASLDTALALHALGSSPGAGAVFSPAIDWLHAAQAPEGGWGAAPAGSMVLPTAEALSALNGFRRDYPLEPVISDGLDWLASQRNADGGFGVGTSTVGETAAALHALKAAGGAPAATDGATDWLLARQSGDGSWNGSVFQTAAAVEALHAGLIAPDLAVTAADIACLPATVATLPAEVSVTVALRNLGRSDVPRADLSLYDGDPAFGRLLGMQSVAVAGPGNSSVSFPLTVEAAGLHELHVVVDGENLVAEANEWNNAARQILPAALSPPPVGFASDASMPAEASGAVPVVVRLDYPWPEPISVGYTIKAGTALPALDYLPESGRLDFAPGETVGTILLTVLDDRVAEHDETVLIELAAPTRGDLAIASHLLTIRDDEAPALVVSSPSAGAVGVDRPRLLYTTTGRTLSVKVDGMPVAKSSGDLLDRLSDGPHLVEVAAINSFGVTTTAEVAFIVDTALPVVTLRAPLPGAVTGPVSRLDYVVTSAARVEVRLDGAPIAGAAGTMLGPLTDGSHTLTVDAWNAVGTKSSTRAVFQVDARPPGVEILSPSNGYTRQSRPVVSWHSDEAGQTTVWLDGVETAAASGAAAGPLSDGVHHLRVAVTDAVGNTGAAQVSFAVSTGAEPPCRVTAGWPREIAGSYGGMAVDRAGNAYLLARKAAREFDIVKFDPAGNELWRVTRSSYFNIWGGNWVDIEPQGLAVDSHGNIYVVGWGYYVSRYYSVLARYDANGTPLNHVLLDTGMLYGNVRIQSVHIDDSDQVYIAGDTDNDLFGPVRSDPATMFVAKYDSQFRWLHGKCYGKPGDPGSFRFVSRDAMTVDASGQVLITGVSGDGRLLVWKLAADLNRTGVEASGDYGTNGADVASDPFGNIYVAGGGPDGGSVWKFAADGRLIAARAGDPSGCVASVAVDRSGGVMVLDCAGNVARLDEDLNEIWSAPTDARLASKLEVTVDGALYLAGGDFAEGNTVIAGLADPRRSGFAFDQPVFYANGAVVVLSGRVDPDGKVVLAEGAGTLVDYRYEEDARRWQMAVTGLAEGETRLHVTVTGSDGLELTYATRVVVDTQPPRVVITAPVDGSAWVERPLLSYEADDGDVRVYVNGNESRKRTGSRLDSLRSGSNRIRVEAVDRAGNVGFAEAMITATAAAVGDNPFELGQVQRSGMAGDQLLVDAGTDAAGNLYLLGNTPRLVSGYADGTRDLLVAKYNPAGALVATWRFGDDADDDGAALVVTAAGGFVIASNVSRYSQQAGMVVDAVAVAAYDAGGTLLWRDELDSGAVDRLDGLAIDAAGNLYAAGTTWGRLNNKRYGGSGDGFLLKYTPQGSRVWTVLSNEPTGDTLRDVKVAGDGFLYATGRVSDAGEMSLVKFDLNGARQWQQSYRLAGHGLVGRTLEVGPDGSIYVLSDTGCTEHYLITKHDRQGAVVREALESAPSLQGLDLAIDAASDVYVTGWSDDPDGRGWALDDNRSFGDEDIFVAKHAGGDLLRRWTRQFGDAVSQQGGVLIFSRLTGRGYLAGVADSGFGGAGAGVDLFLAPLTSPVERSAPTVAITTFRSPARECFQLVGGTASPGATVTARLSAPAGSPPVVVPVMRHADGSWLAAVAGLAINADNVLTVCAADGAGKFCQGETITVDAVPPLLEVDPVVSPTFLGGQTITGRVEQGAALRLAGAPAPIPSNGGAWSQAVELLQVGSNTFTFTAVDAAGNATLRSVAIDRTVPPPPVLAVDPAVMTADDAVDTVLTVNGIEPPGSTVVVTQVLDLDRNGLADGGEPVVRRFAVADGRSADNPDLPADADARVDGRVAVVLNGRFVNDRYHAPGEYVFTATTAGGSDGERFCVLPVARPQSLSGVVRDDRGVPVGGALVELRDPWERSFGFATTDADGRYRFAVGAPGDYQPVATAPGYLFDRTSSPAVGVAAGAAVVRDLALTTGFRRVSGRVNDAASAVGLAGVMVRAAGERFLAGALTSAYGSYELLLADGTYQLFVETRPGDGLASHGYAGSRLPQRSIDVATDLAGCDLSVDATAAFACGMVTTAAGFPAPGVPVQAVARDGSERFAEAGSGASGRYCLALASPGPWSLELSGTRAAGAGVIGTTATPAAPALTVYPVDAGVFGTVRDDTGLTVANVAVVATHPTGAVTTVRTDGQGRYLLGLSTEPAGNWSLSIAAEAAGYAPVTPVPVTAVSGKTQAIDFPLVKPRPANTIMVSRAEYDARKKMLYVDASSSYDQAQLQVEGHGPMTFSRLSRGRYYWTFARSLAVRPAAVTVSGPEGAVAATVR
ncbi:MAG: hypothetical protein FDZ69_01785 [Deltaproteobacteria bacterium]|nr:MAG: hypothetical protein FDZ69_01785 [Deltaproteobacteria bacterium]